MKLPMPLPNGLGVLVPEADLRTIVIPRRDLCPKAGDATLALAQSELAEGLFFAKGSATAQAFRPSYWHYDEPHTVEAEDACAAIEDGTEDGAVGPHDSSRGDDELIFIERGFLATHLRALMQEHAPGSDHGSAEQSEMPSFKPEIPESRVPEADLRSIQLRRSRPETTLVDGLFLRKSVDAASATERALEVPLEGRSGCDTTSDVPEPCVQAREDAPRVGFEDGPVARLCLETAPPVASDVEIGEAAPLASVKAEFAQRDNAARRDDTVHDAAFVRPSERRRPSLAPAQVAILVFGSVALLVSIVVFILSNTPRPGDIVAVQLPQVTAPAAVPVTAPVTAPVAEPVAAQVTAPVVQPTSEAGGDFLARGDDSLRLGDVFAARLYYERAADVGNAHGALMVGATFDPAFLARVGVQGLQGDEKAALAWYRRASALGDPEAAKLQKGLERK